MPAPNLKTVEGIMSFVDTYGDALAKAKVKPLTQSQQMILQGLFAGFMTADGPPSEPNAQRVAWLQKRYGRAWADHL